MTGIEFERSVLRKRRIIITVREGPEKIGSLDYLIPLRPWRPVEMGLLFVHTEYQGRGFARELLSKFVADIGSGRQVKAIITHEGSLGYLTSMNPDPDSSNKIEVKSTDMEFLREIPIVRVLESGGVHITRVRIVYNSRQERLGLGHSSIYLAHLKGETLQ